MKINKKDLVHGILVEALMEVVFKEYPISSPPDLKTSIDVLVRKRKEVIAILSDETFEIEDE